MTTTWAAPSPTTQIERLVPPSRAIDGVRGLAVLAVVAVAFAMPGITGGWIGLEVLFVATGYLVTTALMAPGERRRLRALVRRGAPFVAMLLVVLVVSVTWSYVDHGTIDRPMRWAITSLATQGYNVALEYELAEGGVFAHLWVFSIEWQFFAVLAATSGLLARMGRRRAAAVALILAAEVAVLRPIWLGIGGSHTSAYLLSWFRLDGLVLGVAASLVTQRLRAAERRWLAPASTSALLVVGGMAVLLPRLATWPDVALAAVIPVASAAAALIVLAAANDGLARPVDRVLSWRPLTWIGRAWVSVYLWHAFVGIQVVADGASSWQGWSTFATQIGATAAVALGSHQLVGEPIREWVEQRFGPERP